MKGICAALAFLFAFTAFCGHRIQDETSPPPDTHATLVHNGAQNGRTS